MTRRTGFGAILILVAGLTLGACAGHTEMEQATTTEAPTTTSTSESVVPRDDYSNFLDLTAELGGTVIARDDAAIRAALLCSGSAKSMLGGVSIDNFPTDLALIRSYCPDKESIYG